MQISCGRDLGGLWCRLCGTGEMKMIFFFFFFFFFIKLTNLVYKCDWFLHMLPARAETRMSREKSEVRDLIKSDCFFIELVAWTSDLNLLSLPEQDWGRFLAGFPTFIPNNYKMCACLFVPIINLIIFCPCCEHLWTRCRELDGYYTLLSC